MLNLESAILALLQGKGKNMGSRLEMCVCVLEHLPDNKIISCHRSYLKGQRVEIWRLVGAEQATEQRNQRHRQATKQKTQSLYPIFLLTVILAHFPFKIYTVQGFVSKGIVHNWTIQGKRLESKR